MNLDQTVTDGFNCEWRYIIYYGKWQGHLIPNQVEKWWKVDDDKWQNYGGLREESDRDT